MNAKEAREKSMSADPTQSQIESVRKCIQFAAENGKTETVVGFQTIYLDGTIKWLSDNNYRYHAHPNESNNKSKANYLIQIWW